MFFISQGFSQVFFPRNTFGVLSIHCDMAGQDPGNYPVLNSAMCVSQLHGPGVGGQSCAR